MTDAGEGYLKALGNPEGPHALASEWVGTSLAQWLGLPTLDFAIIDVDAVIEVPLGHGCLASAGPAFITRSERTGRAWSGTERDLMRVANPEAIAGLVVLDTWIRNRDRCHPEPDVRGPHPDNVFLTTRGAPSKRVRVKAIDHTHCFSDASVLTERLADIGTVQDGRVYGFFPAFGRFVTAQKAVPWIQKLGSLPESAVQGIVGGLPREWEVGAGVQEALTSLIRQRAQYLARTLGPRLALLQGPLWLA